ncbi:hypothetical protein DWB84_11135 [Saccharophagus sp. K07]|uniref:hypothetical protein n=1 Tax=Saccharophagus sp. K07 TaxID=2283636 RepID=UPI001652ACA2|nr:hypothetical protein [Saccharophagus sp. K07]MBC6906012.1 hypothetical protein [Saccharophagus sp. K07]
MNIPDRILHEDKIGTAVRYQLPNRRHWLNKKSGRKIYIEPDPLQYVTNLNGYDQMQVCKSIEELASIPLPLDGAVNKQRPAFFKAKHADANAFRFLIKYRVTSEAVVISEICLNDTLFGVKDNSKDERACLYHVKKLDVTNFHSGVDLNTVATLPNTWVLEDPVLEVKTKIAAVNGMLNDLRKASWLMGIHAEHAYPQDEIKGYTLFHNPSESALPDFFESVRDNLGFTTENAKHLAEILADIQRKGQPVKWVVHSQGGIIFKQAVAHHIKKYPGQSLDKNSVVFHAGGNNKKETEKLLGQVGIRKNAPDKDNPFDLVPHLAGRNDLYPATIKRTLQFWKKVKGNETASVVESPHTLPFISLEAYHHFLTLAGDTKSASRVEKYMKRLANS